MTGIATRISLLVLFVSSGNLAAQEGTPPEPTPEQLKQAMKIYPKARFAYSIIDPGTKRTHHIFGMETMDSPVDEDLKLVPDLPFAFGLVLFDSRVTDAGLKELKRLKNLTALALPQLMTTVGMKELKDMKNLTWLEVPGHVWALGELQHLEKLSSLRVSGVVTDWDDSKLRVLIGLPNLQRNLTHLSLSYSSITDAGLSELRVFEKLISLDLTRTQVSDRGMVELHRFPNLITLRLKGTAVTDWGLGHLKVFKNLAALDLAETKITDFGLEKITGLEKLAWLDLSAVKMTDKGLVQLKKLKNLSSLYLHRCSVTDAGMKELRDIKTLQRLELGGTLVTDKGLAELTTLQNLQVLDLERTAVTDKGLAELTNLKNLNVLGLTDATVTKEGVDLLRRAMPSCRIVENARPKFVPPPASPKPQRIEPEAKDHSLLIVIGGLVALALFLLAALVYIFFRGGTTISDPDPVEEKTQ